MFVQVHGGLEAKEWATLYSVGALTSDQKSSFEQHLEGCPACQSEVRSFEDVASQIAIAASVPPPASLRSRLLDQIAELAANSSPSRPGILFQQRGLLISRSHQLPWELAPIAGVWCKTLWVDTDRQYGTSLVRLEPKAVYPSHLHHDVEEVYVLEGDFLVQDVPMGPGDYCRAEPGSIHGQSSTQSGALLLVFSSQKDELLE